MRMRKNFRIVGLLVVASLWASGAGVCQGGSKRNAALGPSPNAPALEPSDATTPASEVNLPALKNQLQTFQQILNRSVQQTFELPFSLLQDAKGIYLPRFGVAVEGATLYCKMVPCYTCSKTIINAGVKRLVALKDYHASRHSKIVFKNAGVKLDIMDTGVEPYKDQ